MYEVLERFITRNRWSRPGTPIKQYKGICLHWVANPMTTAIGNRNFFERRKHGNSGFGSANEVIGLDGEVVTVIPIGEMAYGSATAERYYKPDAIRLLGSYPNSYLYHIECTHTDWYGKMTPETYATMVERCADLIVELGLQDAEKPLWIHNEVTGKWCHRWFCEHRDEWKAFQKEVMDRVKSRVELKLEFDWQWDMLEEVIEDFRHKEVLNSDIWLEKVKDRSITADELAWLNLMIVRKIVEDRR